LAILLAEAETLVDRAEPENKGGTEAALGRGATGDVTTETPPPVSLGRLERHHPLWLELPHRHGRGRERAGGYPELAELDIGKGSTPALLIQVGRRTALLPSIELAREERRRQGLTFAMKMAYRMASRLGAEGPATRGRAVGYLSDPNGTS